MQFNLPKSCYLTGIAPLGKTLVGGCFTAHDQDGIPIELIHDLCQTQNCTIDWMDFLADAGRQPQWKYDWAVDKIASVLGEGFDGIITRRFIVYGNSIAADGFREFMPCCEEIIRRKKANAELLAQGT